MQKRRGCFALEQAYRHSHSYYIRVDLTRSSKSEEESPIGTAEFGSSSLGSIAMTQQGVRDPAHHWLDGGPHAIDFCLAATGYYRLPVANMRSAIRPLTLHGTSHCCFGVRSGLGCVAFVYGLMLFPQSSLMLGGSRHFLPPPGSTD